MSWEFYLPCQKIYLPCQLGDLSIPCDPPKCVPGHRAGALHDVPAQANVLPGWTGRAALNVQPCCLKLINRCILIFKVNWVKLAVPGQQPVKGNLSISCFNQCSACQSPGVLARWKETTWPHQGPIDYRHPTSELCLVLPWVHIFYPLIHWSGIWKLHLWYMGRSTVANYIFTRTVNEWLLYKLPALNRTSL